MMGRITNRVARLVQSMRSVFYAALSTGHYTGRVQKLQPILILGNGVIEFEKNVVLGYFPSPFFFSGYIHLEARGKTASIKFGADTKINNNFVAIAEHTTITIGKRCFIGTNVEIFDSDFHGIKVSERTRSQPENTKPVVIGDDVFIGSNVKIMKGVVIGNGSVIANGAIVAGAIPPNVIAGGNPAKVIKAIE
jgi:maltose O-acetyltransferase